MLLFVHGYKNNFVDAAAIAGQFTYDMAFNGASVMFSWPSQNNFSDYKEDGELAQSSTATMAKLLTDLTALQKEGPVYVVAHSMGNRVLLDGLKQFLKDSSADQTRSITEVVLAAPDVPQKDYKAKWGDNLADNGIYPTLYASKGDLAMNASALYNQNEGPRLGQGGNDLLQTRYLVSIDASEMKGSLFSEHHAYFRDNHTVAKDLYGLLRERKKVEKRPNLKKLSDVHSSWLLQAKISPQDLTFTQLLCPAKCSKTLKSSLQPFIGTKVQIGPNQFSGAVLDSLFDSCDGKIELRPQQQSRQQQLAELKKTIAPWPDGASEFVDIDLDAASTEGIRYCVAVLNNYSGQAFDELERGFAGLMYRDDLKGLHFDPRTTMLDLALLHAAARGGQVWLRGENFAHRP